MKDRSTLHSRLYHLKLLLIGALLLILSLLASALGEWLTDTKAPQLLVALMGGVADLFLVTGAIGIAVDFFTGRERDEANREVARETLKELTPDFTDAVVRGFAVSPPKT